MRISILLTLALTAMLAEAAQFNLKTGATLSSAATNLCAASWGDTSIFTGGSSGRSAPHGRKLDIFVNGTFQNTLTTDQMYVKCSAAVSAYPGVIAMVGNTFVEFFNANTHQLFPYNNSAKLSTGAMRNGAVGSPTQPIMAFATSDGTIQFVNSQTRARESTVLDIGRINVGAALIHDSNGKEYFVFAGGESVSNSLPTDTIHVLPVDGTNFSFVSPTSKLSQARSSATCSVTSQNYLVCSGGNDVNGNGVRAVDVCTIDTSGILTCTARIFSETPSSVTDKYRGIVTLGPFITSVISNLPTNTITVFDPQVNTEVVLGTLPYNFYFGYATTIAGRFAYFAGGNSGVSTYTSNVTIVECVGPCELPLGNGVSTSSSTISSSTSSASTSSRVPSPLPLDNGSAVFFMPVPLYMISAALSFF